MLRRVGCRYLVRVGEIMPLVRIDMLKKTDPTFAQRVGKIVYESMRTAINVPEHDNFQVLTEHDERHFIHDPNYLGIEYTSDLVIIQITLNEGRTQEQKKLLLGMGLRNTLSDRALQRSRPRHYAPCYLTQAR
jgi:hypothetical protein